MRPDQWSQLRRFLSFGLELLLLMGLYAVAVALTLVAIIAVLIPPLGPAVLPSVVSAAATVVIAYFAASESKAMRRGARFQLMFRRLEALYTPLYHAVVESEGKIYAHRSGPWVSSREILPVAYWEGIIEPLMSQNLHLASPELIGIYWKVKTSDQSEALAKEFSDCVKVEFERLAKELRWTAGDR